MEEAAAPPRRSGSAGSNARYKNEEKHALLDIVEEVKPLGAMQWETVTSRYNVVARANEWVERTAEGLKAQFSTLKNLKKGDAPCPSPVNRAKRIARLIQDNRGAFVDEPQEKRPRLDASAATLADAMTSFVQARLPSDTVAQDVKDIKAALANVTTVLGSLANDVKDLTAVLRNGSPDAATL